VYLTLNTINPPKFVTQLPKPNKNLSNSPSFISRDDSSLLNATQSIGVVLGNNEQDVFNSLKILKDQEYNRMTENAKQREENFVLVEDASTICSNEDSVDLEALNLICLEVAEGLGDGGCDPFILQTPASQKKRRHHKHKNKSFKSKSR
jgi:hypothetical protein